MKISRDLIRKSHGLPAERGFIASGVARLGGQESTFRGWGRTPTEARLELLWQQGRRRISPMLKRYGVRQ